MREETISIKGLKVNYKIAGRGPAILVLHGWGGSSDSWVKVQERLSNQKYTVLVLDFPGFGKSVSPSSPWSVGDYMEFLYFFIKEISKKEKGFGSSFFLLGHSFGGRVSIKFSLKYPEMVKKLILCDSAGIRQTHDLKGFLIFLTAKIGNALLAPKIMVRFKDSVRSSFYKLIRNRDYVKAKGVMKETMQKVIEENLLSQLKDIGHETLIIWGSKDKMVPLKYGHVFNDKIRGSQLKIINGVGHSPHLESPEKLSKLISNFFK
ncbi:MAG: alpha/beta hydrolase [Candidatus Nealsonbacteria bacterium]